MAKDQYSGVTTQAKVVGQRWRDAEVLQEGRRWLGAMYVAGYAVECSLKSKLMQRFRCHDLHELEEYLRSKRLMRRADTVFSHQLFFLFRLTGALHRLRDNREAWLAFTTVNAWVPAWRYSPLARTRQEADEFFRSVRVLLNWIEVNI